MTALGDFSPPHIKQPTTAATIMLDAVACMAALYLIAAFCHGPRALLLGLVSALTAFLAERLAVLCRRGIQNWRDLSPIVTGLLIPLMLPASIPYTVVIAADLFAVFVAKHFFGGTGRNIFNPAAAGLAFVTASWPEQVLSYPAPFVRLELAGPATTRLTNSIAYVLSVGGRPSTDATSVLLGLHPGPMGTLNGVVLIACLAFLVTRRSIPWWQPFLTAGVVAFGAAVLPRASMSAGTAAFYEVFGTTLLFSVAFLFSDPVTSAVRDEAKAFSALLAGALLVLFRRFGAYEQSAVFVALLMNVFNHWIDNRVEILMMKERRRRHAAQERPAR